MSLETLEQTLNAIDAETAQKLNAIPTTIDVEVIPAESNPENDGTPVVSAETLIPNNETVIDVEATVVSSEKVESAPVETSAPAETSTVVENSTPVETSAPAETSVPAESTPAPVVSTPVAEATKVAQQPISIPVPRPTETRSVNLIFPEGNFSKAEVAKLNGLEYVTASGLVNMLESQGIVKQAGKQPQLGRGKPTVLYSF